jgi:aspartyl-tRNA(Asn)/glutamyl-tRNA(Gln) amidotransferase subunit B
LLESEADTLIVERKVCDLLDKLVENGIDLKEGATWILTDCMSVLRRLGKTLADLKISAEKLIAIIGLVKDNTVNRSAGKKILSAVIEKDVDPIAYYKEQGLDSQGDTGLIEQIVKKVIDNNPNAVKDYKEGKTKAVGFLFGMIMRELRGNGDPQVINQILTKYLNQ